MSDVLLERWAKRRESLNYHGVVGFIKDVSTELTLMRSLVSDKAEEYDDEDLRGIFSILGSIRGRLEDLAQGRLPEDALCFGTEDRPSHSNQGKAA